jgi:hypothetical protein
MKKVINSPDSAHKFTILQFFYAVELPQKYIAQFCYTIHINRAEKEAE